MTAIGIPVDQDRTKSGPSWDQVEILRLYREERSLIGLMSAIGQANRRKFRDALIRPLIKCGLLAYTIHDKQKTRMQRYRITDAGLAIWIHQVKPTLGRHTALMPGGTGG